jgi:hypothetical protein
MEARFAPASSGSAALQTAYRSQRQRGDPFVPVPAIGFASRDMRHAVLVRDGKCLKGACVLVFFASTYMREDSERLNMQGGNVVYVAQSGKDCLYPPISIFVSARIGWILCSSPCAEGSERLKDGGDDTLNSLDKNLTGFIYFCRGLLQRERWIWRHYGRVCGLTNKWC